MKKKYVKPQIYIETFALDTSIAGTCESIVGNPTKGACAVIGTGNVKIFDGSISDCKYTPEGMGGAKDQWDGFCYHVPLDNKDLFNS